MDLKEYLRVLVRQGVWILGCVGAAIGLAVAYLAVTPATYTARSELFLSAEADAGGTLLDLSRYSEQRAKSYAEIADTPAVLQPVIDNLGMDTTVAELANSIEASVPLETVLLTLEVTREDSDEAVRIADALGASVLALINDLEGEDAGGLTATILTQAELDAAPTSPDRRMTLAAAMVVGLGAGLMLALTRHVRDAVLRTPDDIRRTITQTVDSAVFTRPQVTDETFSRVSFLDRSAVATYLSARGHREFSVYVLHDGRARDLVGTLIEATAGLTGSDSVCLVDTDTDQQPLSKWAGVTPAPGWTDIVAGDATVEQVSHQHSKSTLSLVPSGDPAGRVDPARFSLALLEIRRRYASTIVMVRYGETDSPPAVLGQVDTVLIWVEKGESNRHTLAAQLGVALATQAADVVVVFSAGAGRRVRTRRGRADA